MASPDPVRPLAELTTLRLGGPPRRLVLAREEDGLVRAVRAADDAGEPLLALGGGSNVVVADTGFPGTVVQIATRGVLRRPDPADSGAVLLTAQAGESWDAFVAAAVEAGLSGVEALSGIPGSVGATPIQNVGAYGQEVADTLVEVRVLDRRDGSVSTLARESCAFGYRDSRFKREPGRWIVLAVTFSLREDPLGAPVRYAELARSLGVQVGDRAPVGNVRAAVLDLRRGKGMVLDADDPDTASAGSFFTNPILDGPGLERFLARVHERLGPDVDPPTYPQADGTTKTSAAWLIERAGFARGHGDPATVAISSKHTLALTNRGAGTAEALMRLAHEIADGVEGCFGVRLHPEPVLVGHSWAQRSAAARG